VRHNRVFTVSISNITFIYSCNYLSRCFPNFCSEKLFLSAFGRKLLFST